MLNLLSKCFVNHLFYFDRSLLASGSGWNLTKLGLDVYWKVPFQRCSKICCSKFHSMKNSGCRGNQSEKLFKQNSLSKTIGRTSAKIVHGNLISQKTWPPGVGLVELIWLYRKI